MVTQAQILAVMLRLPQWHLDHIDLEERTQLLTPLAEAIHLEAKDDEEAAALVGHSHKETHFAKLVLTGHCDKMPKGVRCDAGRARGPFQVHRYCVAAWTPPDGTLESYRGGARCVLRTLRLGLKRCKSWSGAFAGLKGAPVCTWDRAARYAAEQKKILNWWKTGVLRE